MNLDQCARNPLRWWPIALAYGWVVGYRRGIERGHLEGRLEAWREADDMVTRFRHDYDVMPKNATRSERRLWSRR